MIAISNNCKEYYAMYKNDNADVDKIHKIHKMIESQISNGVIDQHSLFTPLISILNTCGIEYSEHLV